MKKTNIAILIVLAATMAACGSIKKAASITDTTTTTTTTNNYMSTLDAVIATLGDWQTMQAGGNIKLTAGSSFSSSIQVRMVRDQSIYISLRPMLGIEVGKLIITADSLFAVDKVHKRYIAEKVSLLTSGIPVTVSDVQDIFLGRPFILGKGTLKESLKDQMTVSEVYPLVLTANESYKGYGYVFNFDKAGRIASLSIMPTGKAAAAYQVNYSDVHGTTAGNIAHNINANATVENKKIAFSLNFKDIEWNGKVNIDLSVPRNYKRMSARDLFSMFSN